MPTAVFHRRGAGQLARGAGVDPGAGRRCGGHLARRGAAAQDRLIWVVATAADGRIDAIEPLEQKAGARGLGKPKAVSLATLVKRKDLATHDAALLRAVKREDYGNRPVLDLVDAAPALVRHPFVAWQREPTRFIEVSEGLPALEIMTQGEHIIFACSTRCAPPAAQGRSAGRRCCRSAGRRSARGCAASCCCPTAKAAPSWCA